ncbi:hypothetical protein DU52_07265 [Methanosarcina mazei]|uniref:Uncharacterized protein n=1 Tax=Methanosarcina mazei TaxID=2209 RepID=A0A0F8EBT5_METMZ|nr:hypothetical protein DU52_07265 [Methanosarcina mazei]
MRLYSRPTGRDVTRINGNRDGMVSLRHERAQEQARNKERVASVQQFRNSMNVNVMSELADHNKS